MITAGHSYHGSPACFAPRRLGRASVSARAAAITPAIDWA